jgi:hypothetical protein
MIDLSLSPSSSCSRPPGVSLFCFDRPIPRRTLGNGPGLDEHAHTATPTLSLVLPSQPLPVEIIF